LKKHLILAPIDAVFAAAAAQTQKWDSIACFGGSRDTGWGDTWVLTGGPGYIGTYADDNGRFWLEFTDHVFEGYWSENTSDYRCDDPVMGPIAGGGCTWPTGPAFPGSR